MPTEGFNQLIGGIAGNLAAPLPSPDRSSELDLRQRQDGESMPCVAGGDGKKSIRARLIDVKFNEGTRFQVIKRQSSTPFPQNSGGQWLALDVNRVEIQIPLRLSQYLLHFRHQPV